MVNDLVRALAVWFCDWSPGKRPACRLASGSFLRPLCRVDPDMNRHEQRSGVGIQPEGPRDEDLEARTSRSSTICVITLFF